ncbi:tyrosine-protein phosphatase [Priestia megaterium]|uniref:tyrosine-protein phosphatase n=1 Tax=Priestia megaterium TaxID=1404 RepID=UPI00234EC913|nr:CpsB/CapC family capsule biosynthesis tyrosine phosphatase [Priestia megaterium]MDC7783883.1 tyrosine protein phosphatase [Priestia megaterium]
MIDLHCHIIPKVDDGPQHMQESLAMANQAVKAGITHLFATPHHLNGNYENTKFEILNFVLEFQKCLQQENIPLTIHPGQELRIHRELFVSLEKEEVLTLNNSGKYLLVELPSRYVPTYTQEIVYELLLKGITPIIVHPERNQELIRDHNLLFELVQEGALTQLTSGSIIGLFGKKIKAFSKKIIEHNLVHFIATDAHNINLRGFTLQKAYEIISKTHGIDYTFYFKKNAEQLTFGKSLSIKRPVPIKKSLFRIF